ncbi:poly(R)-hydroxyalkanoic acid synthase subunit PhaE, partial [Rhizobium johnstonii]
KLWSNWMIPFLTTRAVDSSLFAVAQGDEISEAIKRMAEAPRLADMWNLNRQVYALMAAWMDVCQRMGVYHAIASVPWGKAYERYSASLADTEKEDAKDFDWRKGFEAWRDIADKELISNMRSKDFLASQRDLLRAALDLRTRQQEMADRVCRVFGVPNQHDFDDLARQITELRREVRAGSKATQPDAVEGAAAAPDDQGRMSDDRTSRHHLQQLPEVLRRESQQVPRGGGLARRYRRQRRSSCVATRWSCSATSRQPSAPSRHRSSSSTA